MAQLYLCAFISLLLIPAVTMLHRPERVYEFPCFMAAPFGVFILPQALALILNPGVAPASAVSAVLLMTFLCLGASILGYSLQPRASIQLIVSRPVNQRRMFHVGCLFVACGFVFGSLLSRTSIQFSDAGGMTGIGTVYLFFNQLVFPGFAICLLAVLQNCNVLTVSATLIGAVIPLQTVLYGRREPASMFLLTLGMGFFFQRRVVPPRWLIVLALVSALIAIPATGEYRTLVRDNDWASVRSMDLVGNFRRFFTEASVLELRNAAMLIEGTRRSGAYGLGSGYWNQLVFRFVPAQFVGSDVKSALMFADPNQATSDATAILGYEASSGSTVTGIGDSFQQFGWLGCLFFAGMAVLFRSLWMAATQPGGLFAQILYIMTMTSAMRAVTHWTLDFLPGLLYNAIFLGLAMLYAQEPLPRQGRGLLCERSRSPRRSLPERVPLYKGYIRHRRNNLSQKPQVALKRAKCDIPRV